MTERPKCGREAEDMFSETAWNRLTQLGEGDSDVCEVDGKYVTYEAPEPPLKRLGRVVESYDNS